MELIDGRRIAASVTAQVQEQVASLPFVPLFCDLMVGSDPVQLSYVKLKGLTAQRLGLSFRLEQLPERSPQDEVVQTISRLNRLPNLSGLIVQLPLPEGLDRRQVLDAVDPRVDVDCLGSRASAEFYAEKDGAIVPPTAAAVLAVLDSLSLPLGTLRFAVVGQGELVGKPVSFLLERRGYRILRADRSTEDLASLTRTADVVISATGQPGTITATHVKPGAVVIDAGTAESEGGIVGDVDQRAVAPLASLLSPVPGGVGPVTVAMLLKNVVAVAQGGGA